jgi:large subunit ribosomal protein L22
VPGLKTNEAPGTRAVLRHYRMSATKARQVLDLVRGQDVDRAQEILAGTPREAARVVSKVLASATSNARHNDGLDPEELYVSACFADEGATAKRWRPRARGRATRIRKRTCHITVIVTRLPDERLARKRSTLAATAGTRSRRVAASRRAAGREPAPVEEVAPDTETELADAEVTDDSPDTEAGVVEGADADAGAVGDEADAGAVGDEADAGAVGDEADAGAVGDEADADDQAEEED